MTREETLDKMAAQYCHDYGPNGAVNGAIISAYKAGANEASIDPNKLSSIKRWLQNDYMLVGAMTGKTIWKSWLNKPTDKYDDCRVSAIWAETRVVGGTDYHFSHTVRPVVGIYLSGE